jgi:hypothetical protein
MLYISNCGNIDGPNLANENNPSHVTKTLDKGFHVVVDVWTITNQEDKTIQFALGTTIPQYPVSLEFLQNPSVIARAKNIQVFQLLVDNKVHCFLDSVDTQLTTMGMIWTRVGSRRMTPRCVLNLPEVITNDISQALGAVTVSGICSNFIERVKNVHQMMLEEAAKAQAAAAAPEEKKELEPIAEEAEPAAAPKPTDSNSSVEEVTTEDGSNVLVMKEKA